MSNPPQTRHQVEKPELEKLFNEHGIEDITKTCQPQIICDEHYLPDNALKKPYAKKKGIRYFDATSQTEVAVIFYYTNHDGSTFKIINRLTINQQVYESPLA